MNVSEKRNTAEEAHEIAVRIDNESEFHDFNDMFTKLGYEYGLVPEEYPMYIFFDLRYKDTTHIENKEIPNFNFDFEENMILWGVYEKIFTIEDFHVVKKILETGVIIPPTSIPSYKPRKLNRLTESNKPYIYRIKTEEELNEEYGEDWFNFIIQRYNWYSPNMNYLFGKKFDFIDSNYLESNKYYGDDNIKIPMEGHTPETMNRYSNFWIVHKSFFVKEPSIPNYLPKKIDRFNESISDDKTGFIFICHNDDEFQKIQNFLFKNGFIWITGEKTFMESLNDEYQRSDYEEEEEYPAYVFVSTKNKRFFFSGHNTLDKNQQGIKDPKFTMFIRMDHNFVDSMEKIDDKIYTVNDFNKLIRVLNPDFKPTYNPKRIDKLNENVNYNYDVVVIKTQNWDEARYVLTELFKKDFKWASGNQSLNNYNNYPYYLWIESNKIIFHLIDYTDDKVFRYINEVKNDGERIPYKIFEPKDVYQIDLLFKYGNPRPDYSPIKISRLDESLNTLEEANEIYIKVNSYEELNKLSEIHDSYGYWGNIPSIDDDISFPIYVFYNLNNKHISYLDRQDEYMFDDFEYEEMLDGVYNHMFTINDIKTIKTILETRKIKQKIPSYEPRKIIKESVDNNMFVIKTEDRENSLFIESFLHNNDYYWNYHIEKFALKYHPNANGILFIINNSDKNFEGQFLQYINDISGWLDYKNIPESNYFKYPDDYGEILKKFKKPSYKPRKINKLYEFKSNDKISILVNDELEYNKIKEEINKFGYKIDPGYNDVLKELNYNVIIVIDIIDKSTYIVHKSYFNDVEYNGVYDVILSIRDIDLISEILQ
ncbi:MAG: hypothetical protein ACOC3V_01440 [bacterium]